MKIEKFGDRDKREDVQQLSTTSSSAPQTPIFAEHQGRPPAQASNPPDIPHEPPQFTTLPSQQRVAPPSYSQTMDAHITSDDRTRPNTVMTLDMLRQALAFLVFTWLFGLIVTKFGNTPTTTITLLCLIPGVSSLQFCPIPVNTPGLDYARLIKAHDEALDTLLGETPRLFALALETTKIETNLADTVTLSRLSKITNRKLPADTLIQLAEEAKLTSKSLQKLSSKVVSAVATIKTNNEHVLRSISAACESQLPNHSFWALLPGAHTEKKTNQLTISSFRTAMETSLHQLGPLINGVDISLSSLDRLQEWFFTLRALIADEYEKQAEERERLLAQHWSKSGRKKKMLADVEENLKFLKEMGESREKAVAHVLEVMQTLNRLSKSIQNMSGKIEKATELTGGTGA